MLPIARNPWIPKELHHCECGVRRRKGVAIVGGIALLELVNRVRTTEGNEALDPFSHLERIQRRQAWGAR